MVESAAESSPGGGKPGPAGSTTLPRADFVEIAKALRQAKTVDAGLAHLDQVKVDGRKLVKADVLAIAKELGCTLPAGITVANAKRRLLEQAIGAPKKYAGSPSDVTVAR